MGAASSTAVNASLNRFVAVILARAGWGGVVADDGGPGLRRGDEGEILGHISQPLRLSVAPAQAGAVGVCRYVGVARWR